MEHADEHLIKISLEFSLEKKSAFCRSINKLTEKYTKICSAPQNM